MYTMSYDYPLSSWYRPCNTEHISIDEPDQGEILAVMFRSFHEREPAQFLTTTRRTSYFESCIRYCLCALDAQKALHWYYRSRVFPLTPAFLYNYKTLGAPEVSKGAIGIFAHCTAVRRPRDPIDW